MRTGRPPKPTALHKLHNTKPDRARKREPMPVGDLSSAPDWFNDGQRESWDYAISHCPAGVLKMLDRGMLVLWCEAEDRHRLATMTQSELNRRSSGAPFLVKSPLGMVMSPYVEIIDRASKTMFKASEAMGFSPVARPRIKLDAEPTDAVRKADPWQGLLVIPGGKNN